MRTGARSVLSDLRRPEYTGENRCTPCTVVNVAIALGISTVVALFAPLLAPVALGLCLAAIYLRGYLVPGTPELTERFFPDRVLRWFDKAPNRTDVTLIGAPDEGAAIDSEPILRDADVLEFTPDGTDLRLTDEFRNEWRERVTAVRESEYDPSLARLLGTAEDVDPDALDVRIDEPAATVLRDGTPVAVWPSEAALVADVAAGPLLRERLPRWDAWDLGDRGQLLHAVRVFLERCPNCDGELALAEETVESCCRTAEVVTLTCRACDTPVLEVAV